MMYKHLPPDQCPGERSFVKFHWLLGLGLNRTVDNYFVEIEQVTFGTTHIIPGLTFRRHFLIGRNCSYFDSQLPRLGEIGKTMSESVYEESGC